MHTPSLPTAVDAPEHFRSGTSALSHQSTIRARERRGGEEGRRENPKVASLESETASLEGCHSGESEQLWYVFVTHAGPPPAHEARVYGFTVQGLRCTVCGLRFTV